MEGPGALPDVRCLGDGCLVNNLWGHKFWSAIFAVLCLVRRELYSISKITYADLITTKVCHEDIIRLSGKKRSLINTLFSYRDNCSLMKVNGIDSKLHNLPLCLDEVCHADEDS